METKEKKEESVDFIAEDSVDSSNNARIEHIAFNKNLSPLSKEKEDLIIKLVALFFVRNFVKNNEFFIGCNIYGASTFGDLLLKIINGEGNKVSVFHIDYLSCTNTNLQKEKLITVFDLLQYLKSVNSIKDHFDKNDCLNNLGLFEDFEFVIHTDGLISDTFSLSSPDQMFDDVLNTALDQNSIFFTSSQICDNIIPFLDEVLMYKEFLKKLIIESDILDRISVFKNTIHLSEIKEKLLFLEENPIEGSIKTLYHEVKDIEKPSDIILSKLKIYSKQTIVKNIPLLIKTELSKLKDISTLGIEILYKYLMEKLEIWFSSANYYLTKDCYLYRNFHLKFQNCACMPKPCMEAVSKFDIKFFVFPTKDMKKYILNYKVLNIVASNSDISLTCIKVKQVLETELSLNYLWITFETFVKWKDDVLHFWLSDYFPILVIEYDIQHDENIDNELNQLLRSHRNAKLIVVTSDNRKCFSIPKKAFANDIYEFKDNFRFPDLDDQSQLKVLKKDVMFQGKLTSIGSLIGSYTELKGILTATIVCKLFKEDTFSIGPSLCKIKQNFIPRCLELSVDLDINILKSPSCKEIFAVNGISELELRNILQNEDVETYLSSSNYEINCNCNIFCLPFQEAEKAFSSICEHFPLKNIHYFVFKNFYLQWKESRGQTQYLKDYVINEHARHVWKVLDESKNSKNFPQTLLDSVEHHTIVLGESGTGKSTLLNSLQQNTKEETPLNWLIRLNFNGDISLIVKTKKEDYDCEIIIQIIYSLLNYEYHSSEIEHILLRHDLEKRGNVVIICEGLECVSSKYLGKVFDFIHALDTMNIKKLWITSTPNMKTVLERTFHVVIYELQNLSFEDQQFLLFSLWKDKFEANDLQKLKDFTSSVQHMCQTSKIADIPLLAFPLICEIASDIFKDQALEYMSLSKVNWPEKVDVIHFYDKFIQLKELQNNRRNLDHNAMCLSSHELEELFTNRHMLCALLSLLDIDELVELNLLDILDNIPKIVRLVKRFGIIQGIVNKKPIFLHKTFAEYFAALWFSQNIEKSRLFMKQKLFDLNFTSLSRFFDYFLIRGHELHSAVLKNDFKTVKSLIAYGVDVNALDKAGRTALHLAVIHSKPRISTSPSKSPQSDTHNKITKLLVDHSINRKMIDNVFLWRPVQYAIELKKWDAMDLLLQEQVSFNDLDCLKEKMNNKGFVQEGMLIGSEKGYFNLIECFSSCGINIAEYILETKDGQYSPLHIAAKYGQLKLVRFFLSKKIKVSIKNNKGVTPLHLAAAEGMVEVLVYLLQRGADLQCTDKDGNTPLDCAILRGNLQMVILLIEQYNANVNSQNKYGDITLHHAVKTGNITIIEYILMKEAQLNICNRDGNTPLHLAVWLGTVTVIQVLLEYGADVNICNKSGDTPLSQNAGGGNLDTVKILVENGADINKRGDDGNTALHWAARQDSVSVVEYLLTKGADINSQNKYGNTALHRAVENGCLNSTKLLVNAGSNIQLRNSAGYTAGNIRSRSKEVAECIAYLV